MTQSPGAHRRDDPVEAIAGQLVAEYRGALPPGAVLGCVARCRYQLRRAGVRAGLEHAVEAMARDRLRQLHAIRVR